MHWQSYSDLSLAQRLHLLTAGARNDASLPFAGAVARISVSGVERRAATDANMLAAAGFVREAIRYAHESPESFAGLEALFQLGAGDCDCMSRALAALLLRLGYSVRWALGWSGGAPVHIWVQAWSRDAHRWVDLDPSTWSVDPGDSPENARSFEAVTHHII